MKKLTPGELPLASEKTPDAVGRIVVRASLSPRRGKSIGEIAELCDLGISATRRHLENLIEMGCAKQTGSGQGAKYLSSREIEVNLTSDQADQMMEGIREHLLDTCHRWRRSRGLPPR